MYQHDARQVDGVQQSPEKDVQFGVLWNAGDVTQLGAGKWLVECLFIADLLPQF